MRKNVLLLLLSLLYSVAHAQVLTGETDKRLAVSSSEATTLTTSTSESTQWYMVYNVNCKGYLNEQTSAMKLDCSTKSFNGLTVSDYAGYLFRLTAGTTDGSYQIISGKNHSFSISYDPSKSPKGSSAIVTAESEFKDFYIANIASTAGQYYIQQVDNSVIADGNSSGGFLGWETVVPASVGGNDNYRFYPVSFVSEAYANLSILVASCTTNDIAEIYGATLASTYSSALSSASSLLSNSSATEEELTSAYNTLKAASEALAAAMEKGVFIRLQSAESNKYLDGYNSTNSSYSRRLGVVDSKTGDNEARTIFFYKDNKLVSYASGYYPTRESTATNHFLFFNGITSDPAKFEIRKTGISNYGTYFVVFNSSRYLHADEKAYADAGNSYSTSDKGYSFEIETVESLPLTVGSTGYATLYCPLALTIPEGVTAYTIRTVGDDKAYCSKLTDGVIPAGCGVVLTGTVNTTYNFPITTTDVTASTLLNGSVATLDYANESNIYILANDETQGVGFYLMSDDDRVIHGSRAYYQGTDSEAKSMTFSFFEDETTGIKLAPTNVSTSSADIFDLTGRRVSQPKKGIYIQNGHKYVVK